MKKYIVSIVLLLALKSGFAQGMKASIGAGATQREIRVYLMPDATQTATISTLQFNVAIPTSINPAPTLSLVTNNIAGVTWIIDAPFAENGFWHYNIYNAQAGYSLPCTAATEIFAMELRFVGGPDGVYANTAHLVTLPDGGANGATAFICTGTINASGQDLYYARNADVVIANGDSYFPQQAGIRLSGPLGTFTSFARLVPGILLPVKFTGFTAVKQEDNGLLNWSVEGESSITDRYEVERSFNGINFTKAFTVAPKNNGSSANSYALTDMNLSALKSSGVIYYRIKQVDKDGNFAVSEVRNLRVGAKGNVISVYPNPVKESTVVNMDLVAAGKVSIIVYDPTGKDVMRSEIQGVKGLNRYKLDMSSLASGTYQVKVTAGTDIKTLSIVKTN